jgi:osmotically-inducible protein OsmY
MKNDLLLQQDVIAELNREPTVDGAGIGVEVHHGVVKLAGHVSSSAGKWNAERAAQRVDGVTAVVMDIDVTLDGTTKRIDADIACSA